MNLPDGTHLAYAMLRPDDRAANWTGDRTVVAQLTVQASDDHEPGAEWDIIVQELKFAGETHILLSIYDDGFGAVVYQIPEFFAALAERHPTTLNGVRIILDSLGAVNETVAR